MISGKAVKYATHGAAGGLVWNFLWGSNGAVRTPFGDVPVWGVGFGLGVASSVVTDMAHAFILPYVSENKKFSHYESALLAPAASAAAILIGATVVNPNLIAATGYVQLAGIAAVSEILAQYTFENFTNPAFGSGDVPAYV